MRRLLGIAVGLLTLLVGTACSDLAVLGSGHVVSETRDVSGFDSVHLKGTGTLIVAQGDHEALTIDAEDNILPLIQTEVEGNKLTISFKRGRTTRTTQPIIFHLTVKEISKVALSGSGTLEAQELRADHFETTISGAGRATIDRFEGQSIQTKVDGTGEVTIAGTTSEQTMSISGAGGYHAGDLTSQTATISIEGSGEATVRAARTMNVKISGSGTVNYYGSPSIEQKISGSGKVVKLGD